MFDNIWEAIKTHKWVAIGIGGAVIVGVIIYAVTHKSSTSSTNNAQDLLATPASGPSGVIGSDGTAGGGGGTGITPANPVNGVSPIDTGSTVVQNTAPAISINPTTFTPAPTTPGPVSAVSPSTGLTSNTTQVNGLTGVNYNPTPNTPNQVTVGSAAGLTQIALPVGETMNTPVTVSNASAGNPTVPLSDLISTGSTNTLSSAYGNAQTAAVASQSVDPGTQAALNALVAAQFGAAGGLPKTTPVSQATPSTKVISSTPAKTLVSATSVNPATGAKTTTVVSTAPAAGQRGILKG